MGQFEIIEGMFTVTIYEYKTCKREREQSGTAIFFYDHSLILSAVDANDYDTTISIPGESV
jgi:hypothetical protein